MRLECEVLGQSIRAEALRLDEGWDVCVFGGSRSHVGAVTLAEADGSVQTLLRRNHRDDAVSVRWAQALECAGVRARGNSLRRDRQGGTRQNSVGLRRAAEYDDGKEESS